MHSTRERNKRSAGAQIPAQQTDARNVMDWPQTIN